MIQIERIFSKSAIAGIILGFSCFLYLSCQNTIVGSILFAVGMLYATQFDINIFTDKSCSLINSGDARRLSLVLILNVISAFLFGFVTRLISPEFIYSANAIVQSHYNSSIIEFIIKSVITGFLISTSVSSNISERKFIYVICAFVVAQFGFYHCNISAFYYGLSDVFYEHFIYMPIMFSVMIISNFIGCNLYNLFVNKSVYIK